MPGSWGSPNCSAFSMRRSISLSAGTSWTSRWWTPRRCAAAGDEARDAVRSGEATGEGSGDGAEDRRNDRAVAGQVTGYYVLLARLAEWWQAQLASIRGRVV